MARILSAILAACISQSTNASLRLKSESGNEPRKLSYDPIANYVPESLVTDANAIDLDQKFLEQELDKETQSGFRNAQAIYRSGGNSMSIALITLTDTLPQDISVESKFLGYAEDGDMIDLTLHKEAKKGTKQLHLRYDTISVQSSYSQCRVGGLPQEDMVIEGCLRKSGKVKHKNGEYQYSYSTTTDNYNDRNLQYMSRVVESDVPDCKNCQNKDAEMFTKYYGQADYGDEWIMAAFDAGKTTFSNGNADFSSWGYSGRAECIKKGTVYMNLFMFVLQEFENGLVYCNDGSYDNAVNSLDKGVAYYTGSEEGGGGEGDGLLLYNLADKRCQNFKTCGLNGDLLESTSQVNHQFLKLTRKAQGQLKSGECAEARKTKEMIADIMYIPLIQGTLRYAYKLSTKRGQKEEGEGAVFAAAVLPRVHAADPESAEIIYDNMRVGAITTNFKAVQEAFESVYKKMNIPCEQVGGVVDKYGYYLPGTNPCGLPGNGDVAGIDSTVLGIILGSVSGVLFIASICSIMFVRNQKISALPEFESDIGDRTFD